MKHLISLLAFSFLIGCDGEKSNVAPSKDSPEEAATETKPPEAVSVNPNLKYVIIGDTVTITGCDKKASGHLIIPATIKGKPVTSIATSFYRCSNLTSITIPEGVTSIGNSAFHFCTSLKNITIPDTVTSIGTAAFLRCTSLTSITIGSSVSSIGTDAFRDCTNLTSITIPDSVTSIGFGAINSCTSLTSITIGDSVASIGKFAFLACSSLTAVTFLGDAPEITNDAFKESSPTIYREADAKGWGDTFAGRPVKLITEKP